MKKALVLILVSALFSCSPQANSTEALQHRIDSLESAIADAYKPGFGEFMSNIQAHHAKLWFAGQNANWQLADFEAHEIMESVEYIQKYQTERDESELIGVINPALDSVSNAIQQKNPVLFERSYIALTNTCNRCHRDANFAFNVVKIPDEQTFSNQDFKVLH